MHQGLQLGAGPEGVRSKGQDICEGSHSMLGGGGKQKLRVFTPPLFPEATPALGRVENLAYCKLGLGLFILGLSPPAM